jgi:hypothetical protein
MQVVRGRAANMPLVVSLAYGLNQYYESLGVALVRGLACFALPTLVTHLETGWPVLEL